VVGGGHRGRARGVRYLAARGVAAPARAARGRVRDRPPRGGAAAVRRQRRAAARCGRLARHVPRVLDPAPGRPCHRDSARPPATPAARRGEQPRIAAAHEISSVGRRTGSRTLAAGEARTLTIARVYDTGPEDLWDACTNPERITRWFLPISGDLREGGHYALEG